MNVSDTLWHYGQTDTQIQSWVFTYSGLPKVIFLAVAEAKGKGGKTSALEVEAEGEAKGLVFCI